MASTPRERSVSHVTKAKIPRAEEIDLVHLENAKKLIDYMAHGNEPVSLKRLRSLTFSFNKDMSVSCQGDRSAEGSFIVTWPLTEKQEEALQKWHDKQDGVVRTSCINCGDEVTLRVEDAEKTKAFCAECRRLAPKTTKGEEDEVLDNQGSEDSRSTPLGETPA